MTRLFVSILVGLLAMQGCGRALAPKNVPGTLFSDFNHFQETQTSLEAELAGHIETEEEIAGIERDETTSEVLE